MAKEADTCQKIWGLKADLPVTINFQYNLFQSLKKCWIILSSAFSHFWFDKLPGFHFRIMSARERPGRNITQVKPFQAGVSELEKTRVQQPRKAKSNNSTALFDANGIHIASGLDICDCADGNCPGCHFDCEQCKSPKCGTDCRRNRKTIFISRKDELTGEVIKNPAVEFQRAKDLAAAKGAAAGNAWPVTSVPYIHPCIAFHFWTQIIIMHFQQRCSFIRGHGAQINRPLEVNGGLIE
jgi:hypothetical protein